MVMRVRVRSQIFESAMECANHFGITKGAVYNAIRNGRADTIGIGQGKTIGKRKTMRGSHPKPFTSEGVCFRTRGEASLAFGKRRGYVSQVMRLGGKQSHENLRQLTLWYINKEESRFNGVLPSK